MTTSSPVRTATSAHPPFTREAAADLVAASKEKIYAALGIKVSTKGAFPFLVGLMVDGVARSLRAGGPAEVLLPYENWADIASARKGANGNRKLLAIKADSLKVPFTKASETAADVPGTAPALRVSIRTPGVRGTKDRHGLAGMDIRFLRGENDARLVGDVANDASPVAHPLASELEDAREWRKVREGLWEHHAAFRRGIERIAGERFASDVREIGTGATLLLQRWGVSMKPVTALLLACALTLAGTVFAAYGAWRIAAWISPRRYEPIPEGERPKGSAQSVFPVSGVGWSGVVEVRSIGVDGALLTFVPETLPPPAGGKASLVFIWHVSEEKGPSQTFFTRYPQLFYRYSVPRTDAVHFVALLTLSHADTVEIRGVPLGSKLTASARSDGPPVITAEVYGPDGSVERVTITPVPLPASGGGAPNTRAK